MHGYWWGLCELRHGIQISMEAILACHPAGSTEWLDCHPKSCELWRIRTGPITITRLLSSTDLSWSVTSLADQYSGHFFSGRHLMHVCHDASKRVLCEIFQHVNKLKSREWVVINVSEGIRNKTVWKRKIFLWEANKIEGAPENKNMTIHASHLCVG